VIRKRRKGLQVQVFAGRDPLTGRKRWLSRQVDGQTKAAWREAKKVEAQLLEQVDRGERRDGRSRTIGELVERWLEWRQQVRPISPVTVANYRGAIDRYILPNLGRAMLHEVDAATLDTLYARVRATGGKCRVCWKRIRRGEPALRARVRYWPRPGADEAVHEPDCARGWPVSASAVREVHSVLSGAFKQAVVWGWTTHNPAKLATPPAAGRADVAPPDPEGVARLLTAAMDQDPELGLFLRLAVVLGARRSELIALKWREADLAAGEVLIASGVVRVAGRPLIDKDTKTHANAAWLSAPRPWSCSRPTGHGRPRRRWPPERPCRRRPMCSPGHLTAAPPSAPMGSPTASRSWPPSSAFGPACMICVTSWSPSWSPAVWTGAPSPVGPATPTGT
jgi:integrase